MPKLKIGDRVRSRRGYTFDPAEGTIVRILSDCYVVKVDKGKDNLWRQPFRKNEWSYCFNEVQLIEPYKKVIKQYGIVKFLEGLNDKV